MKPLKKHGYTGRGQDYSLNLPVQNVLTKEDFQNCLNEGKWETLQAQGTHCLFYF